MHYAPLLLTQRLKLRAVGGFWAKVTKSGMARPRALGHFYCRIRHRAPPDRSVTPRDPGGPQSWGLPKAGLCNYFPMSCLSPLVSWQLPVRPQLRRAAGVRGSLG